ncbi:helix-turn-helix domain-containing protein [Dactylosporangium sp. NPDC049742]|uniref:helix-turn-helix domain-containing protein n=1 Tax=Dactylosporangium sp. NPDC049742 TaxID=3154737 RepID=UPI00343C1768
MVDPEDLPVASPGYVPEPGALKALVHPLRLQLLEALSVRGQATATQLAAELGESSGATSYHLRQLARHGFIEEVAGAGTGPERWWRPVTGGWTMPASVQRAPSGIAATAGTVIATLLEASHRRLMEFFRTLSQWPLPWQRAASRQQAHLELTPEQLRALAFEVEAVVDRYRQLPPGPDTRRVRVEFIAFPVGEPGEPNEPSEPSELDADGDGPDRAAGGE